MNKRLKEIEERMSAIAEELEIEGADLTALEEEVRALKAEKATIEADAEKRSALLKDVMENGTVVRELGEERTMEPQIELRNTVEYGKAFIKAVIGNDDTELRALLSGNVSGGYVPVPETLDNEIRNAWENCQIMSLVKRTNYKGNVKVGFEYSATGAVVHVEGNNAPEEEVLQWGTVELKAQNIKKWITVSDEAIENTTIDTLSQIYREVAQRIAEKAEAIAIGKITTAASTGMTLTCAGAVVSTAATIEEDTIVEAVALLSGQARNLHIAMSRQTYAAFVSVALQANYAIDVFDGLKDRVVFTDALPAYSSATTGDTYAIIGDFGYGFQANFPNGNDLKLTTDNYSLAEKDLVKIVGRQFVGMDVVAPKAFVCIQK